jgi:uncharacterized protein YyaL (SSP411 family)
MGRLTSVAVLIVASTLLAQSPEKTKKPRNRLATETSPYLRMHAHNPTNWYPWGPEAFEKAKKENKLVFLSVGYSSCYWCHVMERESFDNDDVAKLLNDNFVCIKVDREERPDIDHIYMTALQAIQQRGGWPMSMFLLPDGRPLFGGTYWPREDKTIQGEKVPGFMTILTKVRDLYREKQPELEKAADEVASATVRSLDGAGAFGLAIVELDRKLVAEVVDSLKEEFDPEYGGFGSPIRKFNGPKFPQPGRLEFMLKQAERTKDDKLLKMVTLTLDKMAEGGIYDHVGGGFHRYSTERTWLVPHFEKMLYDNAQLAELYAKAYRVTKNPTYKRVVAETLAYIEREMMSPEGAFYSSQDAETEHEEGRFYVWTQRELAAALPDAAAVDFVREVYGADGEANFEKKFHILYLPRPLAKSAREQRMTEPELRTKLEPLRKRLYDERAKRVRPFRNEIALTAWSGLTIAAFTEAGTALGEPRYLDVARKSAKFVLDHQKTADGRLLRTYGAPPGQKAKAAVAAYLEDYAFLVHGLLNLYDATKEKQWLNEAAALTDTMTRLHGEPKRGGYFMTANDHEKLFARSKDQYDGPQPSGNSAAGRNLVRLWIATGDEKYKTETDRLFRYFAGSLKSYGPGMVTLATALDRYIDAKK